jgi:hypothetical protein
MTERFIESSQSGEPDWDVYVFKAGSGDPFAQEEVKGKK